MQTAFARALTGGDSTAVLQHPWKSLYSSILANSSFTTVFTEAVLTWLLPSVSEGCLAERNMVLDDGNTHGPVPATQNDSLPGPGKTPIHFCI